MSKRYREVLDEVETPTTRRASRPDRGRVVAAEEAADTSGAPTTGTAAATTGGGGVATLVRPARPTSATVPSAATTTAATTATATVSATGAATATVGQRPVTMRSTRPGNGPADADEPLAFAWRGRRYEVTRILGHWREEEGWWRRPDGEPIRIEQSDLWRVEAVRGPEVAGAVRTGIYELARRGSTWRLDRVWD